MTSTGRPPDEAGRPRRSWPSGILAAAAAAAAAAAVTVGAMTWFGLTDGTPRPPTATQTVTQRTLPPSETPSESSTQTPSGPPTQVPSSATPRTSRERYEEAARRELEEGQVAYNVPQQARVKEEFQVTARVQRGILAVSPSLKSLPGTAPVTVEKLRVGTYMRAELRGGGFDIEPTDDTLQLIDDVAEWTWQVTPLSSGSQPLRLTLVVEMDELPLSKRTFERTIDVAVEKRPPVVKRFLSLFDWSNVVTALLTAALIGVPQLFWKWWKTTPGKQSVSPRPEPAKRRPAPAKKKPPQAKH